MLRLDIERPDGDTTYYVTPFVTDGDRLYLFDEPGERSEAFDALLMGHRVTVSSRPTGELAVSDTARWMVAGERSSKYRCSRVVR